MINGRDRPTGTELTFYAIIERMWRKSITRTVLLSELDAERLAYHEGAKIGAALVCQSVIIGAFIRRELDPPNAKTISSMMHDAFTDMNELNPIEIIQAIGAILDKRFPPGANN